MEQQQIYSFCALLSRMKYITRWGLMRSSRPESLSEHVAETSIIAHILGLIAHNILGETEIDPSALAVAALYHDASEILTGDLPTPVKYKNETLKTAYKALEQQSAETLAGLLPKELQATLLPCLTGQALTEKERVILKAADRLSALIKCMEEEAGGNTEFSSAKTQQIVLLQQTNCPAANYFMQHFLPCYAQNLDELTGGAF